MKLQQTSTNHSYYYWDRDFLSNSNVIGHLTVPFEHVSRLLHELSFIARYSPHNFESLVERCQYLIATVPILLMKIDIPFVVRCRPGYKDGTKIYSSTAELSYNPRLDLISCGRFNMEEEPVFYAAIPSQTRYGNTELTSILEAYKEVVSPDSVNSEWLATLGRWDVNDQFMAVNLSLFDRARRKNQTVANIANTLDTELRNHLTDSSYRILHLVYSFFSFQAGTAFQNNESYLITNAFKKALKAYYGDQFKAIVYSSSMTENACLNIAIEKELIDNGTLNLHGVSVYKIQGHRFKKERFLFPCSNYARPDSYGNFQLNVSPGIRVFE